MRIANVEGCYPGTQSGRKSLAKKLVDFCFPKDKNAQGSRADVEDGDKNLQENYQEIIRLTTHPPACPPNLAPDSDCQLRVTRNVLRQMTAAAVERTV